MPTIGNNKIESGCPNCGYCPHCGRSDAPRVYPLQPIWITPHHWTAPNTTPYSPPAPYKITC